MGCWANNQAMQNIWLSLLYKDSFSLNLHSSFCWNNFSFLLNNFEIFWLLTSELCSVTLLYGKIREMLTLQIFAMHTQYQDQWIIWDFLILRLLKIWSGLDCYCLWALKENIICIKICPHNSIQFVIWSLYFIFL